MAWPNSSVMDEAIAREFLICPACRTGPFTIIPFERDDRGLVHGILRCDACRSWYRVEDRLPELLPHDLRDAARGRAFMARFHDRWQGWSSGSAPAPVPSDGSRVLKAEQMEFFRTQAGRYDDGITAAPFWIAFDRLFLDAIGRAGAKRGVLVEVGCGTGRLAPRLAEAFRTLLGFDLSEAMAREAMRRFSACGTLPGRALHFVADADHIPVRGGAADCVLFAGVLSYVAMPAVALAESVRILAEDGVLLGHENNASVFRPCFDLLMALHESWVAKSYPPHGALSGADLVGWLGAAGMSASYRTEVFLPPHVFNLLPPSRAERLMRFTNATASRLPWIRRQGGLLLFSGRRKGTMEVR